MRDPQAVVDAAEDMLELQREGEKMGCETPHYNNCPKRDQWCSLLGCSDRTLRKAVAYLIRTGHPIGVGKSGGYYLITDPGELARRKAQFRKRAMAALVSMAALDRGGGVAQMALDALGGEDDET